MIIGKNLFLFLSDSALGKLPITEDNINNFKQIDWSYQWYF